MYSDDDSTLSIDSFITLKLNAMIALIIAIKTHHTKNALRKTPMGKGVIDFCPHFLILACEKQEPIWAIRFPFTPLRKTLRVLI